MSDERQRGQSLRRVQMGLRRLTQELHRLNDAVGTTIDLRPGDLELLDRLGRDGPLSPSDISARTGLHPATLTGMIDRLEEGGWVSRAPDSSDRRRVVITADTSRGGEVARMYAPMTRSIAALCADYGEAELDRLADFLERAAAAGAAASAAIRDNREG